MAGDRIVTRLESLPSEKGISPEGGTDCERDGQQSQRIQDIASEVLRLRLVQAQQRQIEGQLRRDADKLQQLSIEKMLQLRSYFEHGIRFGGGGIGTLGSLHGGLDHESLLGLMECLCVVCDVRVSTKKKEDLLLATKRMLQDPIALIERLVRLPAAPSSQSRRLAPFLLSCDIGWRGQLSEAGQCYETLRSWLSSYYQFSLVSSQMQTSSLQKQERLLEELTIEAEGNTGFCTGGTLAMYPARSSKAALGPTQNFGRIKKAECSCGT